MITSARLRATALAICALGTWTHSGFAGSATTPAVVTHKVGAVTWHAKTYAAQIVSVRGYVLALEDGYLLFSDEPTGAISAHDLPVEGPGTKAMVLKGKYVLVGRFVAGGLKASNGNPYHLELTMPPQALSP